MYCSFFVIGYIFHRLQTNSLILCPPIYYILLKTLQIIALVQGFIIVFALLRHKAKKHKPAFWLLIGSVIAVLMYLIGDDDNNLVSEQIDWFFFDATLFITFFFLFVKYFIKDNVLFQKKNLLFFIPNIIYFIIEITEDDDTSLPFEIFELCIEAIFLGYLLYTIIVVLKSKDKSENWLLYFLIPMVGAMSISILDEFLIFLESDFTFEAITPENSYMLIITAFLFYFITLKLILSPKEFNSRLMITGNASKYATSGLNTERIDLYKTALIQLMEDDKVFKDNDLNIEKVANKLEIPRQYISELLNNKMNISFQDFVNEYRVNEFIMYLESNQFPNYTLLGLANEVGFNSKSSFNAAFKKFKKQTPSQFKKSLLSKA